MLKAFIRAGWVKLPRPLRSMIRSCLESMSPCKASPARSLVKGDIVVAGFLGTANGLGQGARSMLNFFKAAGLPAHGGNFSKLPVIAEDFEAGSLWPAEAKRGGVVIIHMNPNLFPLGAYRSLGRNRLLPRRIIGLWYWELGVIPEAWRKAFDAVDEIWAPSRFVADALKTIAGQKTIHVVPCLLDVQAASSRPAEDPLPQLAGQTIVFFMYDVGSTHARKNPCAAIEAFRQAAGDNPNATLVLKINNAHIWPQSLALVQKAAEGLKNIHIIQEQLTKQGMADLLVRIDIAMSLHRSEGFGLFLVEAMAAGKPVIATNWSGNTDFMTKESSELIDYTLVDIVDPQHVYDRYHAQWAEPDVGQAAQSLQRLLDNPAERQQLGEAGRKHIRQYLSQQNCFRLLPETFWRSLDDPAWRERLLNAKLAS